MQRAEKRIPKGDWSGPAADTVVLTHHDRHRRRMRMLGMNGTVFVLDLTRATTLRDGDGLMLDDGRIIAVKAAAAPCADRVAHRQPAFVGGNQRRAYPDRRRPCDRRDGQRLGRQCALGR